MFAKIFSQIFDSTIADDYLVRHIFMDLLVLADSDGVVDMTISAISRRTNVPAEIIESAIKRLSQPDTSSRSDLEQGKRLTLVDSHRDWGWKITNYRHYRQLVDEESRRSYFRDKQRQHRALRKVSKPVFDKPKVSKMSKKITQAEAEANKEKQQLCVFPEWLPIDSWKGFLDMRKRIRKPVTDHAAKLLLGKLDTFHSRGYNLKEILDNSTMNNWQGLFEPRNGNGNGHGHLPEPTITASERKRQMEQA